ncbi:MAG: type II secretion system F family protein [Alphaproteobacteria bacterium]|nr:type II secretion system F family protein [Alphaproteobacteria bacterium]
MPSFNYKAINDSGRMMRGEITAANEIDLEERLREIGLDLVNYKEKVGKKSSSRGKVKINDLIVFCLHFEQLDRAGVPVLDSIADVRDAAENPRMRDIMAGVYESVKNGQMFSEALAKYPNVFDDVFVGLVSTGEQTGDLSESFTHLADHMKWSSDIQRKVKKAVRYPIGLLILLTIVIAVLMVFVVPKLIDFIVSQGFEIPLHTRALIATSAFFADYWYVVPIVPTILFIVIRTLYRHSEAFAYKFDGMMLKLPVVGPTMRKIDMARFTHFFAVMFKSGVDILQSLDAATKVVSNRVLKETILTVRRSVATGNTLTDSLRISSQFPSLVVRMFKVGEDSGNMNDALENINFFYSREVNDSVDKMVGMIQPTLTIVMGMLIFWIIAAIFGPLYESFSKMNI